MSKELLRSNLERLIDQARADKEAADARLEQLENMLAALNRMDEELADTLLEPPEDTPFDEPPTHFDLIVKYLHAVSNEPQTIAAIERGTGILRSSLTAVLYRTHTESFVKQDSNGPTQAKVWSLRTAPAKGPFVGRATSVPSEYDEGSPGGAEGDIPF